jgi:hypothetical protein
MSFYEDTIVVNKLTSQGFSADNILFIFFDFFLVCLLMNDR